MRKRLGGPLLAGLCVTAVAACTRPSSRVEVDAGAGPADVAVAPEAAAMLGPARQLVFEGLRSGEGYFSPDGTRLVFQSEREPGNPFYQIYTFDLGTGDVARVSPGVGKTTCSWFHPSGDRVLFASTHLDPQARAKMKSELDFRASGEKRRYSWDYDPAYDLFAKDLGDEAYVRLTGARGYDAEGSYSPDGSLVVFASNRRAYDGSMTADEQERFDVDPAYMIDLYRMNADGGDVRRLTTTAGYDGGPFFSPDGERITWRRFSEDGATAEIWTMKIDGTDAKQITRLDNMSWAPFYHPSGDYLVFTTNRHGFENFELYVVDAGGTKEPVRVTEAEGFDGLPVFSPDGRTLAWTSNRTTSGRAQLFLASWNDAEARRRLGLAPAEAGLIARRLPEPKDRIERAKLRADVEALTADDMGGRLTGTPGEIAATAFVARRFEELGLKPAGDAGFFQSFEFTSGVRLGEPNVLVIEAEGADERPPVDAAWRPLAFSKPGSIAKNDLVFAGYGIRAKGDDGDSVYDAYGELDVKGRWVVVLRYLPEDISPERRQELSPYASLRYKAMEARDRGAVGLIVVTGPRAEVKDELVPMRFDGTVSGSGIPAVSITNALAAPIFERAGKDLSAVQAELDQGEVVPGFALSGTRVGAHVTLDVQTSRGRNVLARLDGASSADELVFVGAHVDHLGRGEAGDSLARGDERDRLHPGADDNASGVAALLAVAAELARSDAEPLDRGVVFAAWSGEELGLYGSSAFWEKRGDDAPAIRAYLNMDMVGRLRERLALQGFGSSSRWSELVERANAPVGLSIRLTSDAYLPTDATPFFLAETPVLSAFTGAHGEYHTPRDTADRLNYSGLEDIARLMTRLTRAVANAPERLDFVRVAPPKNARSRRTSRVYLGTIPAYASKVKRGVELSGVVARGPAEAAGLQGGDVLIRLAGRDLENIYDYVKALDGLAIGKPVEIVVLREGREVPLEIVPGSRE